MHTEGKKGGGVRSERKGFLFSRHTANHDVSPSGTIKLKTEMEDKDWKRETGQKQD